MGASTATAGTTPGSRDAGQPLSASRRAACGEGTTGAALTPGLCPLLANRRQGDDGETADGDDRGGLKPTDRDRARAQWPSSTPPAGLTATAAATAQGSRRRRSMNCGGLRHLISPLSPMARSSSTSSQSDSGTSLGLGFASEQG